MPKISAPSVAEHRANQRAALIRAGEDLLRDDGLASVMPRRVCERAGLSRSSFYDYFTTRDDLLVAIAIAAIEKWEAEIEEELTGVDEGLPALRVFVDATMAMTADGRHDIAGTLQAANLSPSRMEDLMVLHDTLLRPLIRILSELDVANPVRAAMLVQGALGAGVQLVTHGLDPQTVSDDVFRFVTKGLLA